MMSVSKELVQNVQNRKQKKCYEAILKARFNSPVEITSRDAYGISIKHVFCEKGFRIKNNGTFNDSQDCGCPKSGTDIDDTFIMIMKDYENAVKLMSEEEKSDLNHILNYELNEMKDTISGGATRFRYFMGICTGVSAAGGITGIASYIENARNRENQNRAVIVPSPQRVQEISTHPMGQGMIWQKVSSINGQTFEHVFGDTEQNRKEILVSPRDYLTPRGQQTQSEP